MRVMATNTGDITTLLHSLATLIKQGKFDDIFGGGLIVYRANPGVFICDNTHFFDRYIYRMAVRIDGFLASNSSCFVATQTIRATLIFIDGNRT